MKNCKGKVLIAVTNDISSDERIRKVSEHLNSKGYEIVNYGRELFDTFDIKTNYKIIRKKHLFNNNFLFYAEFNIRLLYFILINKFDYILSNDLDTLPSCFLGSKVKNVKLIYDSHEYFTEVPELQNRNFVRSFWLLIERILLPKVKYSMTVSQSIANDYRSKYGVNMLVVRNLPILAKNKVIEKVEIPTKNKFILYQGVLNPGRGIKPMIDALKILTDIDLVIVGYGKVKDELIAYAKNKNLENRVHFLGRVPYNKLINYSNLALIGMVLEEPFGKSFEYSLPNKLFDFIHAELPIIAAPIKEVKRIVEDYKIGLLIKDYSAESIAEVVNKLTFDDDLRLQIIENQKKAKIELCWENEAILLDNYFN